MWAPPIASYNFAGVPDGRVHVHALDFGSGFIQPPHGAATDRHVIEIGDQERAARHYLRLVKREMRGAWLGKHRRQFRVQGCDQQLASIYALRLFDILIVQAYASLAWLIERLPKQTSCRAHSTS